MKCPVHSSGTFIITRCPRKRKMVSAQVELFLLRKSQLVLNLHTFSALFRIELHILTRLAVSNTSAFSFVPLYRNSSLIKKITPYSDLHCIFTRPLKNGVNGRGG